MSALSSTLRHKAGRPTKKTPARCKAILKGIESGWPYAVACSSAGTTYESFSTWCRTDEHFAAQVARAEAVAIRTNLELIQDAARDKIWPAAAWLLERRHPELFARPEVQLNLIQQNNISTQGATGPSFETAIVSDLEFLGLKGHESYTHHPAERPAREIEATVSSVPEDLSGVLKVVNRPGSAVISESQARESRRRVEQVEAQIEQLLKTKRAGNGSHAAIPEPSPGAPTALVPTLIVMPAGEPGPGPGWWRSLTTGSGEREIERATAEKVCRLIVEDVFGRLRAQQTPVSFEESSPILLRDVHQAIEDLCGSEGWKALIKRGEA
jgi:hypothetical protein